MPPAQQQPEPFTLIGFEGFTGLNTDASRPGIKDTEMSICDGWMPIGESQLRTIPGIGNSIFTVSSGATVEFFDFGNVGTAPLLIVSQSDGSLWSVNTSTGLATQFAPAGTITNPARQNVGLTQWGSQYILIVSQQTNGYYIWDNSIFYQPGTIGPIDASQIIDGGTGYTSVPSYTVFTTGSGTGVDLTVVVTDGSVTSLTVTNPGTGFAAGDIVQVGFAGGGSDTTPILEGVISGGSLSSITIVQGGTNLLGTPLLTVVGDGTGATATATVSAGAITGTSISAAGSGYTYAAIEVQSGLNNAAYATLTVMPFGISGTAIETYDSRVWIANGNEMLFSAPQSYTDFATSDGGGSFQSNDSFLRVSYVQPRQTNGFLYLIADSSVNYIAGVQTSGNPPSTTFTNQNADPEVGTPYAATIDVLGSNIIFANAWGVHVSYGGRVTKVSNALDGIFNTVPNNFGGFNLSACKSILFGKRVWALLIPVIDQITGAQVNKFCLWDEKRWWTTQQDVPIIYCQHQEIASVLVAYGTDGTNIYPLFQNPSATFIKTVQSKLWSKPGGFDVQKSSNRIWLTGQYYSGVSPNITVSVDNETGTNPITITPNPAGLTTGVFVAGPTASGQVGNFLGMTITTNAANMALISAAIDAVDVGYRG